MSVYVDDAFIPAKVGRISSRWCHLFADTEEELHAFAQRIGLRRSWYQVPKGVGGKPVVPHSLKAQMWHYDITEGRRGAAVAAGAIVVTRREGAHLIRARHARLFPEHAVVIQPPVLDPPEHVWPTLPDKNEMRDGVRWCRRCGRVLWTAKQGEVESPVPCRVIRVTFRDDAVSAAAEATSRTPPGGIEVLDVGDLILRAMAEVKKPDLPE